VSIGLVDANEGDCSAGAVTNGAPCRPDQSRRKWSIIDDGVPPLIEDDRFWQKFGTITVGVTQHRIDGEVGGHVRARSIGGNASRWGYGCGCRARP
jgi:hypothetical protein